MEVKPGYKQTEVGVIPTEWDARQIRDVCKLINGRGFKPHEWKTVGLPIIRIQNLNGSEDFNFYSGQYNPKILVEHGQLLFAWSGSRGTSFGPHVWNGGRALLNYHTWKVAVNESKATPEFLLHAFRHLTSYIEDRAHGASALVHTQKWEMEKFPILIPSSLAEQRAIAGALSDVDAQLVALDLIIAKKRDLKQAAMQQLLTGQTRLPGFHGEWELKRLDNFAPLQRGFDLPTSQIRKGDYPVVYSNGVLNHHAKFMVKGPGVVTGRSGTIGNVHFVEENFWPHNTSLWVTAFKGNCPKFVYYLLTSIGLERFSTGSGVPTLNRNDVHASRVSVPPSSAEQTANRRGAVGHGRGAGGVGAAPLQDPRPQAGHDAGIADREDPARMKPIRIFISSVQKELELERAAVAGLIATDPFLIQHCVPVLFEKEPPPPRPAKQPCLDALSQCAVYVLMIANEYGQPDGEISATHHEYRRAQQLKLPTVVFLKGAKDDTHSPEVRALIAETKKDGYTYKRFHDREDLKPLMLQALRRTLAEAFGIQATSAEVSEGEQLIDAASTFESAVLPDVSVEQLDQALVADYNHRTSGNAAEQVFRSAGEALHARGLAVRGPSPDVFHATVAACLLFGPHPANRFPHCEILADAYDDVRATGRPKGQSGINAPLPRALGQALKFIDEHTFHPRRVVGLNNVRLDEYPTAALREALVNAVAHRSYDDSSRRIFVRIFRDRIEVASPGYPPKPLTLAKLRRGGYRPCSRNPLIAQTLATLSVMEQRGTGFARMREAMLNHGLDEPRIDQQDGFFVVTLPGPAGKYDRLKVPAGVTGPITPAIESQLNERQKKMAVFLAAGDELTSRRCEKEFGVSRPVAAKDFAGLIRLGLAEKVGSGRSTRYRAAIVK